MLSVAAILAATDFSFSQSYSITPNDTVQVLGGMEDLQTLTISQQNNGNDTLYFRWQKVSESVPANWEASVCDNFVCYTTLKDSGATNPVFPTESGFILLHVTPHVNYGTAVVRYAIWDIANPTIKDTLTFITTVNAPSAITETENNNAFNIFPNPVSGYLNITSTNNEIFSSNIFNSFGEKVSSTVSTQNSKLETLNLSNGVYTLLISTNIKSYFIKQIVIQH